MRIIPRRCSLPCTVVLCVPEEGEGGSTAVGYEKRDGLDRDTTTRQSSVRNRERPGLTAFSREENQQGLESGYCLALFNRGDIRAYTPKHKGGKVTSQPVLLI